MLARFIPVALLTGLVYGATESAGRLARAVTDSEWRWSLMVAAPFGVASLLVWGLWAMVVDWRERRPAVYAGLAAAAAFYGWGLWALRRWPAEQIHLIEYGALGVLSAHAFAARFESPRAEAYGLLLAAWIGLGDEIRQGLSPGRYYDLADVAVNVLSAALGLALWRLLASSRARAAEAEA